MGKALEVHAGDDGVVRLPRWLWAAIGAIALLLFTGAVTWATWVSNKLVELERSSIDRETVEKMIVNQSPYVRDAGSIHSHLSSLDKACERQDHDLRRLGESLARMEAKVDLMLTKVKQ